MKILKFFLLTFILALVFSACDLKDNVDPKAASEVPVETMFANAQLEMVNQVNSTSVNLNISRLLVQYWQESTYFTESRYNFQDRGIPDLYSSRFYVRALRDFKEAKGLLESPDYGGDRAAAINQVNIIEICNVYAWHCIVDAFGDMPYSEALDAANNAQPKFDDDAAIYADLISRLTTAVNGLDFNSGSWGSEDAMFGGDLASWKKFGASLLLRLGMRMADADAGAAQAAINSAMGFGVYAAGEEAALTYIGVTPHVNTIYNAFVIDGRSDYLPGETIIEKLKDLSDPRLSLWFTEYEGEFVGATIGLDGAQSYNNFSHFTDMFFDPTLKAVLIDYSEVEFLMAEGVERGLITTGTAEEHYNNAITASIESWGGAVGDYLTNPDVAYSTATGDWKQKIGEQKWIALYNRGVEAWANWRLLDHPILLVPEGLEYSDIPLRMPYPYDAGELNGTNYDAAATAIGGDNVQSRVFWDKN